MHAPASDRRIDQYERNQGFTFRRIGRYNSFTVPF